MPLGIKLTTLLLLCWQWASGTVQADVLGDIQQLSAASMQGRKTGTEGSVRAQEFISQRYQQLGLKRFNDSYRQAFSYGAFDKSGVNVLAYLPGCTYPQHTIVVSAHYDHLGQQGRKVFYGADDNASGVAAMLELAARLSQHCPVYSYIFLATDAEEGGLYGSKAFVANPPVPLTSIILNLNLDMVSRADRRGRFYLTGARRYPALMDNLAAQFPKLQFLSQRGPGRMARDNPRYNWLNASDHGPFYRAGISYLFFGGQEHAQYHSEDDQWQRIAPEFLAMALQAIWHSVQWVEQQPPGVLATVEH
jgi:Zn-dependent M28 family amino/carboxypeptidase